MLFIRRGEDKDFAFQAKNYNGGIINLENIPIYFTVKADKDSTTVLFQKMNTAAGGSDSQIQVIDNALGLFIVKVKRENTLGLNNDIYYCDVFVDATNDSVTINEALRLIKTVRGSGDATPSAPTYYMSYSKILRFSITGGTVTYLIRSGWDINPTVAEAGGTITVTSSGSEFTVRTGILSYNQNSNYSYISTSSIEIYPPASYGTLVVDIWIP